MSSTNRPKYPNVVATISDRDGNAFMVLAIVTRAMKAAKVPDADIDAFQNEATSGGYDNLLQTCMKWVTIK